MSERWDGSSVIEAAVRLISEPRVVNLGNLMIGSVVVVQLMGSARRHQRLTRRGGSRVVRRGIGRSCLQVLMLLLLGLPVCPVVGEVIVNRLNHLNLLIVVASRQWPVGGWSQVLLISGFPVVVGRRR